MKRIDMAGGAALCCMLLGIGSASAMPIGNLTAAARDPGIQSIQNVDYFCGQSYGCWYQPNTFYPPVYETPRVYYGYGPGWYEPGWDGRALYRRGWYGSGGYGRVRRW